MPIPSIPHSPLTFPYIYSPSSPVFSSPLLLLLLLLPFIPHTTLLLFWSKPVKPFCSSDHSQMADLGSASSRRMWCSIPERMQLHVAMLALQFGYAGFHVVSRAALNMGVSKLVFPVYRNIIALLLLLPFAYFLEKFVIFSTFCLMLYIT